MVILGLGGHKMNKQPLSTGVWLFVALFIKIPFHFVQIFSTMLSVLYFEIKIICQHKNHAVKSIDLFWFLDVNSC